jgi:diguanylate cyclase (GGDEF)-like protein
LGSRAVYYAEWVRDIPLLQQFSVDLSEICAEIGDPVGEAAALRRTMSAQENGLGTLQEALGQALEQRKFAIKAQRVAAAANEEAVRDPLTGLTNRRGLESAAPLLLERITVSGGVPWLILIDVDRFKHINDRTGHPAGDAALREIARVLRAECRAEDLLARWAGDEFVVLLGNTGDHPETGPAVAERIRAAVDRHDWTDVVGTADALTLSIGVVAGRGSFDELFVAADTALYQAKRNGRNRVEVRPRLDIETRARMLTRRNATP